MGGAIVAHIMSGTIPEPISTLTCMAAAVAPDLDFYSRKLSGAAFLKVHHGFSHSIIGITVQSFLYTAMAYFILQIPWLNLRNPEYRQLFPLVFFSLVSHLLLDWVMHNNGMPFLWPFSRARFAFPLVLGVNPQTVSRNCGQKKFTTCLGCQYRGSLRNPVAWIVWTGGIAGLFLSCRAGIALATIAATIIYLSAVLILRERARTALYRLDPDFAGADAFPAKALPNLWLFVISRRDGSARAALVESFSRAIVRKWHFPPPLISPFVEQSAKRVIADLVSAVRHHYPEVHCGSAGITHINFRDLSFIYGEPLELGSVKVDLDKQGTIVSEVYRGVW